MKKNLLLVLLTCFLFFTNRILYPQNIDSAQTRLKTAKEDTNKLNLLNYLTENAPDDIWPGYNEQMGKLAEKLLLQVNTKITLKAEKCQATYINNLGIIANLQGKAQMALEYFQKGLHIRQKNNDKLGMSESYGNLSDVYRNQNQIDKALDYLNLGLKMAQELKDKYLIAVNSQKIGRIYEEKGKLEEALNYYDKGLKLFEELGDKSWIASNIKYIGEIYQQRGELDKALDYYEQGLKIAEDIQDNQWIAVILNSIGTIYLEKKNIPKAEEYAVKTLSLAKENANPKQIRNAAALLREVYLKKKNYKDAYAMHELYFQMRDSINNQEIQKTYLRKQYEIEYERQEAIAKAEQDKKDLTYREQSKRQRIIIYAAISILILVAVFAFFTYTRFKLIQKQKDIIEQHQKEIVDSINYAKRIQQAVLKEEEHVSKHLPPHFILFKPKDIVSGDFYWALEKAGYLYLTAADCTGHGVPGAFLTMLGTSFLNEINAKDDVLSPAEILNQLRDKIVKELGGQGITKDGMDISLIRLDLKTKEVMWAGAYNPLWYIQEKVLKEIKADKQPIGYTDNPKPFTDHILSLKTGDLVYLFTDGFADQFGGEKGKKFKYKQLEDKLLAICNTDLEEQKEILQQVFTKWKGNLEQVDDVTIIGIKL
jgi:serine phosphatase RsbU (regulator of sigma subunit)